jgi:hypothetical protein
MASASKLPLTCWICGMVVSLEACMVDEHGMAVHEECSVGRISARRNLFPLSKLPAKPRPN